MPPDQHKDHKQEQIHKTEAQHPQTKMTITDKKQGESEISKQQERTTYLKQEATGRKKTNQSIQKAHAI